MKIQYDSANYKLFDIGGEMAKQAWDSIQKEAADPDPVSFSTTVFDAKTKVFGNLSCWNYVPAQYSEGKMIGRANCEVYSCNLILKEK